MVLLALAPVIAVIDRIVPALLLPLSLAIYLIAIAFQINAPTWPVAGGWFFNPLSWQFIYILGFVVARGLLRSVWLDWLIGRLRWPAIVVLILSTLASWYQYLPDPAAVPWPAYLFLIDKTYLTPFRLIHALSICVAFAGLYPHLHNFAPWLTRYAAMLGRNSLHVLLCGLAAESDGAACARGVSGEYFVRCRCGSDGAWCDVGNGMAGRGTAEVSGMTRLGRLGHDHRCVEFWRAARDAVITRVARFGANSAAIPVPRSTARQPAATPGDGRESCMVPGATIANTAPLPHLASVLKAKKTVRVLAIGSSSTAGVGATSPQSNYPNRLEVELEKTFKDLDFVMVNRGVSGEIAETTSERLKIEVTITKPDLVLWQVGTNDALSRIPVGEFARIISRTLRWIKAQKIDVVDCRHAIYQKAGARRAL